MVSTTVSEYTIFFLSKDFCQCNTVHIYYLNIQDHEVQMTTSQKLQRLHSTTFCVLYFADFQRGEINDFLNVKVNRTLIIHHKQFHVVPPSLKHRRQPQLNYSTAGPRINDKAIFGTECRTNTLMYIGKADAVFHPVHTAFPAIAYSLQIHIFDAAPVVISKQDQRVVAHSYVDRDIDIAGCYGCSMTDGILDYRL